MSETILVIGATGMLGEPVARRLAADGHTVRVMSRSRARAEEKFGAGFYAVEGDINHVDSLEKAMQGCTGVHLNLASSLDIERGARNVGEVAAQVGTVKRITLISGASTCEENTWFPLTRAKLEVEQAIQKSNVPWTIFRCTMFNELLPHKLVRHGRAIIMGKQTTKWHWIAGDDYAGMVSRAFTTPEAANKVLYALGPDALTYEEAMMIYQPICAPEAKITKVPFWILHIVSWFLG